MIIKSKIDDLRKELIKIRSHGKPIGFVPTMGALHEGHLSLIRKCKSDGCCCAVSIFVNPTQFGPLEDLEKYPRPFEKDCSLCEKEGVDIVFAPEVSEMYTPDHRSWVNVEKITDGLCGAMRPGHFRGVATIVAKLFLIVLPDFAYFGRKDYQQLKVIEKMVADLNFPVKVIGCPTVRDYDGIALSSRNVYLSSDERARARIIPAIWKEIDFRWNQGKRTSGELIDGLESKLREKVDMVEYFSAYHPDTLDEIDKNEFLHYPPVFAMAVRIGTTRLIDNFQPGIDRI